MPPAPAGATPAPAGAAPPPSARPPGAAPSPPPAGASPATHGEATGGLPVRAGDLVVDQPGPTDQAAIRQALAEVLETRTYGAGFTVRVRSVEVGRGRTTFEVDVLRQGRPVGEATHTLRREGGVLVAEHNDLRLHRRGLGFGRDWDGHLERWYRASGVDHISLHATRAGTYAWARLGYRWVNEGEARNILGWLQTLMGEPDVTPSEAAAARDILDRAQRFPWGDARFPEVVEIADIGRLEPGPPGRDHLGRRVLASDWHGRKDLR